MPCWNHPFEPHDDVLPEPLRVDKLEVGDADTHLTNVAGDILISTDDEKTIVLEEPVWDDLMVAVLSAKPGVANPPAFDKWKEALGGSTGVYLYFFPPNVEDDLFFAVQMPHCWKVGTDIYPHIHWIPKTTADGNPANQKVVWGLEYAWANIGETFPTNTLIVTASDHLPADANVVAGKHYLTPFTPITPGAAQDEISTMLICRLFRKSADGADNYEGDAGILQFDIHYQIDTMGSRKETEK